MKNTTSVRLEGKALALYRDWERTEASYEERFKSPALKGMNTSGLDQAFEREHKAFWSALEAEMAMDMSQGMWTIDTSYDEGLGVVLLVQAPNADALEAVDSVEEVDMDEGEDEMDFDEELFSFSDRFDQRCVGGAGLLH